VGGAGSRAIGARLPTTGFGRQRTGSGVFGSGYLSTWMQGSARSGTRPRQHSGGGKSPSRRMSATELVVGSRAPRIEDEELSLVQDTANAAPAAAVGASSSAAGKRPMHPAEPPRAPDDSEIVAHVNTASDGAVRIEDLRVLDDMGFGLEASRVALEESGGDVERAIAILANQAQSERSDGSCDKRRSSVSAAV